ncbi:hypothetical protein RIF29_10676 [Crotalaria pallida]|uniref:Uncharacterized protein n=1 Tax=Crotalaria pallida TaxID=3830 RepID=A0AAN9FVG5_CROPI
MFMVLVSEEEARIDGEKNEARLGSSSVLMVMVLMRENEALLDGDGSIERYEARLGSSSVLLACLSTNRG